MCEMVTVCVPSLVVVSSTAVTDTCCGTCQFCGVKVIVLGETVAPVVVSDEDTVISTFDDGASESVRV